LKAKVLLALPPQTNRVYQLQKNATLILLRIHFDVRQQVNLAWKPLPQINKLRVCPEHTKWTATAICSVQAG
jgi:hypothetical protein